MTLAVVAMAATGPWGTSLSELARWLGGTPDPGGSTPPLPNVPGFATSPFINLTRHTQAACMAAVAQSGTGGAPVGIVLASVLGDTTTADKASVDVAAGLTPQPLLFYQSVPVSVLGHLSIDFPIDGPLLCVSGGPDLCHVAVEVAELMLVEHSVRQVIVTYVDAGTGPWRASAAAKLADRYGEPVVPDWDCCVSLVAESAAGRLPVPRLIGEPPFRPLVRPLADFLALAGSGCRIPSEGDS